MNEKIFGVMGAGIAGILGLGLLALFLDGLSPNAPLWFQAFGTLLAFGAVVYVHHSEVRIRRTERKEQAALATAVVKREMEMLREYAGSYGKALKAVSGDYARFARWCLITMQCPRTEKFLHLMDPEHAEAGRFADMAVSEVMGIRQALELVDAGAFKPDKLLESLEPRLRRAHDFAKQAAVLLQSHPG